jgi:Zn-dependent protease with chaperone function
MDLYPSSPPGIPASLARPTLGYRLRVVFVLCLLAIFVLVYLALMAGSLVLLGWAIWPPEQVLDAAAESTGRFVFVTLVRLSVGGVAVMLFAFLLKGLLRREAPDEERYVEVGEAEQPELFRFLRALCAEVGTPLPEAVLVSDEVNAAVLVRETSGLNLIVPPRRALLLGLGLVQQLNLVEFKAVLAHELGHFAQRSLSLTSYVWLADRVIHNMVFVEDRWDQLMIRGFDTPWVSAFAVPLYMIVEGLRWVLKRFYKAFALAHLALRRQMEFNADLMAVRLTGSDALVHVLLKSDFSWETMQRCTQDLAVAADAELYTRDLFVHHEQAALALRVERHDPALGQPPEPPAEVFKSDDSNPAALMWADHPPHIDRERNARRRYWPSPRDERPAALLFANLESLRAEVTDRFYRQVLQYEPAAPAEPATVEAFLAEERAASTFPPRYRGVYERRCLELPDLDARLEAARAAPPPSPPQLQADLAGLYPESLQQWHDEYTKRLAECDMLRAIVNGVAVAPPQGIEFRGQRHAAERARDLLEQVQQEVDSDQRRLMDLDAAVLTAHYHVAGAVGRPEELCARYRFQAQLDGLLRSVIGQHHLLDDVFRYLAQREVIRAAELPDLIAALRQARWGFAQVIAASASLTLPPLRNVKPETSLSRLLPAEPCVDDIDPASISLSLAWIQLLLQQVRGAFDKLSRLQVKSLTGLLALQEELVATWTAQRAAAEQPLTSTSAGSNPGN